MKPRKTVSVPCVPVADGSPSLAIYDVRKKKKVRVDKLPGVKVVKDEDTPPHVRLPVLKFEGNDVQVEIPDAEPIWVRELEGW